MLTKITYNFLGNLCVEIFFNSIKNSENIHLMKYFLLLVTDTSIISQCLAQTEFTVHNRACLVSLELT